MRREHPLIILITHWVNFFALAVMVTSGWRIYNASPLWEQFDFPLWLTFGGWLAGARQWHFLAMWVFFVNGAVWMIYNLISRHGRRTTIFRASDFGSVLPMIQYYLRIRKEHPPQGKYNALQKAAYTTIPFAAIGAILSGIAIYWPVQFSWLTALFGGYEIARYWHFICMAALVMFFVGHLFMVAISGWSNAISIVTGGKGRHD